MSARFRHIVATEQARTLQRLSLRQDGATSLTVSKPESHLITFIDVE
jgi:hypothetical protein